MNVLILGIDGYIGFPLALRFLSNGYNVYGADNFYTRKRVKAVGSDTAIPINTMDVRVKKVNEKTGKTITFFKGNVSNPKFMYDIIKKSSPDVIVHLAEQRSAPYSMIGLREAVETLDNNINSTMNLIYAVKDLKRDAHIIKLGTMGEYGTPNIDIPEGFFDVEYHGRHDYLPFPRSGQSWYHLSKVHDTNNLMLANKIWNLTITDVMQGVVYGTRTEELNEYKMTTRFDIDEIYGTVLNRFVSQAVLGMPLTVYGAGNQKRGFLSLEDSITCLSLIAEHPENGSYNVINQFDEYYSLNYLAEKVKEKYEELYDKTVEISHINNPRVELDEHYYNPEHKKLSSLGFKSKIKLDDEIYNIIKDLNDNRLRLIKLKDSIMPKTFWKS